MKHIHYYIIGIVAVILMAACSSSRQTTVSDKKNVPATKWKADECVTARLNLHINANKGNGMTLGGNLKMKRNEVIILNATYIFGMQIGTIEMTRDYVLIVSRYTRHYMRLSYPQLSQILQRDVTFNDLQDIFWGDSKGFKARSLDWQYAGFTNMMDGRRLPSQFDVKLSHDKLSMSMTMALSNHKYESGWKTSSSFNLSTYEEVTPEMAMKVASQLKNKK